MPANYLTEQIKGSVSDAMSDAMKKMTDTIDVAFEKMEEWGTGLTTALDKVSTAVLGNAMRIVKIEMTLMRMSKRLDEFHNSAYDREEPTTGRVNDLENTLTDLGKVLGDLRDDLYNEQQTKGEDDEGKHNTH